NNNQSQIVGQILMNNKTTESFEWDSLVEQYPNSTSYLNRSSQRVEGQNAIIKNTINKMAQAVWYMLQSVNKHQNFKIEYSIKLYDTGFVEEAINVLLILVNKLILTNQLKNVVGIWELNKKQLEDDSILLQQLFTDEFKEQERSEISSDDRAYFTTLYKMPYKLRKEYVKANNLSKKAIQLGLVTSALYKNKLKGSQEVKQEATTRKPTE
ncbi:15688_t:CDS:2, partial [Gigaspora margarita]